MTTTLTSRMAFLVLLLVTMTQLSLADTCPQSCSCIKEKGNDTVLCLAGELTDLPIEAINKSVDFIEISAPDRMHSNSLTIGPVFVQPVAFKNLKHLCIDYSNIPSIGEDSFWGLDRLVVLKLRHNNITTLTANNFRGLANLTELHLDDNLIEQMPSEAFHHLLDLRVLVLSNNRITALAPRVFRSLSRLERLDLSGNYLDTFDPEVFEDVKHVEIFQCRYCNILEMNTSFYKVFNHLSALDLAFNRITSLSNDKLAGLPELIGLYLGGNSLKSIDDYAFQSLPKLKILNLTRNKISYCGDHAFSSIRLFSLDLSHNQILNMDPKVLMPIHNTLSYFSLKGNSVKVKDVVSILRILPNIGEIDLAEMNLNYLPKNAFYINRHLTALNLSGNGLKFYPARAFIYNARLRVLDLSKNEFKYLELDDLMEMEKFGKIFIESNPWDCLLCTVYEMKRFMRRTVLNETLQRLICDTPSDLANERMADLNVDNNPICKKLSKASLPADIINIFFYATFVLIGILVISYGINRYITVSRSDTYYTTRARNQHIGTVIPGNYSVIFAANPFQM